MAKVLVETSVLIAASLNCFYDRLDFKLVDTHHMISKPLFEFFKNNIGKYGITTHKIENSAEIRLKSLVMRRIREQNLTKKEQKFEVQSAILIEVKRNFEEVKKYLAVLPVDDEEVNKVLPSIVKMYFEIKNIILKEKSFEYFSPISGSGSFFRKMRWATKEQEHENTKRYNKLRRKFEEVPPDQNDYETLAQAYYLKEHNFKGEELYLASTDFHFSKMRDFEPHETLVPEKIKETFGINCDWPDEILSILKNRRN